MWWFNKAMRVKGLTLPLAHLRYSVSSNLLLLFHMRSIKWLRSKGDTRTVWTLPSASPHPHSSHLTLALWYTLFQFSPNPQRGSQDEGWPGRPKHKLIPQGFVCSSAATLSRLPLPSSPPGPFSAVYISLTVSLWPGSTGQCTRHGPSQVVHWLSCQVTKLWVRNTQAFESKSILSVMATKNNAPKGIFSLVLLNVNWMRRRGWDEWGE